MTSIRQFCDCHHGSWPKGPAPNDHIAACALLNAAPIALAPFAVAMTRLHRLAYIQVQEVLSQRSMMMADGNSSIVPTTPAEAVTPHGINHLVINVRDIEESHKFWTETLGFKQVAYSKRRNGKMRFYSGDHDGRMNHHDIALCEHPNLPVPPAD